MRLLSLLVALAVAVPLRAADPSGGPSGKLAGTIIDAATGDPIPGATVVIEGTARGAATNTEGQYTILNLDPGTYTVIASMVGYARVRVEGVSVSIDRTTRVDFEMHEEAIQGEEILIVAQRPLLEKDRTTSISYVGAEEIANLPVQEVSDLLQLQSDVSYDSQGRLHMRGGRAGEVAFLIDGIPVTNQLTGGSKIEIENNSIQELQVISGVFNAEYGQAQSGIVNIVTKSGSNARFSARASAYLASYVTSHGDVFMGADEVSPDENSLEFTLQGPVTFLPGGTFFGNFRNVSSDGWLYGERRTRIEDTVPIQAYIREAQQSASDRDNLVGIPIPDSLMTGDGSLVALNDNARLSFHGQVGFSPLSQLRVSYAVFLHDKEGRSYQDSRRYAPDGVPTAFDEGVNHILSVTHAPSSALYYELGFSYQASQVNTFLFEDPLDPRYQGSPYGTNGFVFGGTSNTRQFLDQETILTKFAVESQIDNANQVKAGAELQLHEVGSTSIRTISDAPVHMPPTQRIPDSNTEGNDSFSNSPREFAAFLQDKVEIDEIVLNLGLRYDYWNPNSVVPVDPEAITQEDNGIRLDTDFEPSETSSQVSPRVGIAFPISNRGVLHLSYGHFFQVPRFSYIYTNSEFEVQLGDLQTIMGNANLKPESTIAYELGLQQAITDSWKFELTVYYKDIKNLLGQELITTRDKKVYARYVNRDYGNTRGVTFSLLKPIADLFALTLDYTYQIARGNASDPNSVFFNNQTQPPIEPEKQVVPLDWDQRHTINGTLIIGDPGDWTIGLVGRFATGQPYTPTNPRSQLTTQLENSENRPHTLNIDVNMEKHFDFGGFGAALFLRVYNALDRLNPISVYSSSGNPFQPFRSLGETEVLVQNPNFSVDEIDLRPDFLAAPRRVLVGFNIDF